MFSLKILLSSFSFKEGKVLKDFLGQYAEMSFNFLFFLFKFSDMPPLNKDCLIVSLVYPIYSL